MWSFCCILAKIVKYPYNHLSPQIDDKDGTANYLFNDPIYKPTSIFVIAVSPISKPITFVLRLQMAYYYK